MGSKQCGSCTGPGPVLIEMRTIDFTAGLPRRLDGKMQMQVADEGWATRQHSPCDEDVAELSGRRAQLTPRKRAHTSHGGRGEVVVEWRGDLRASVGELRPALDLPANFAKAASGVGVRPRRLESHTFGCWRTARR